MKKNARLFCALGLIVVGAACAAEARSTPERSLCDGGWDVTGSTTVFWHDTDITGAEILKENYYESGLPFGRDGGLFFNASWKAFYGWINGPIEPGLWYESYKRGRHFMYTGLYLDPPFDGGHISERVFSIYPQVPLSLFEFCTDGNRHYIRPVKER